jgi:hypothetical protein
MILGAALEHGQGGHTGPPLQKTTAGVQTSTGRSLAIRANIPGV